MITVFQSQAVFTFLMSSDVLFCPTNSPKVKDNHFTITEDEENQQLITLEKLETEHI